jgi:DNA-binding IclR family transcriptional regulator
MKPATTIVKVCRLLEVFRDHPSMGITELAAKTELLASDVHRILISLEPFGYIEQDPNTKKYHLGLEPLKLGHTVLKRLEVREVGRPLLRRLSQKVESTVNMAIFDSREPEIIFVEQIDSPTEVQIRARIGAAASPYSTGLGKTITAFLDPSSARKLLKKSGLNRRTSRTITDAAELEREFAKIRAQGYAVDREEAVEDACCLAAPVHNHTGVVVAAISVSMMATRFYRWNETELATIVKASAAKFSATLGYEPKNEIRRPAV